MHFDSLTDAAIAFEKQQAELETMLAVQVGMTAVLCALMTTHPRFDQFQLRLTSMLEVVLGGTVGSTLTPKQREAARLFVEQLQTLKEARGDIRPLDSAGI